MRSQQFGHGQRLFIRIPPAAAVFPKLPDLRCHFRIEDLGRGKISPSAGMTSRQIPRKLIFPNAPPVMRKILFAAVGPRSANKKPHLA